MSAAIVAKMGLDIAPLKEGLKAAVADTKRAAKDIKGGGGLLQLEKDNKAEANIVGLTTELLKANSAGDVLAGTLGRLPDIFASSLLVGAIGGIGAALVTSANNAQNAFRATLQSFEEFDASVLQAIKGGGIGQLDSTISAIPGKIDELNAKQKDLRSFGTAALADLGAMFGGKSSQSQRLALMKEERKQEQLMLEATERRVALEETLTEIARLRAQGSDAEAETLEAKMKLQQEIAQIEKVYSKDTADRLKALKTEQFSLAQLVGEKERQLKEEEECTKAAEEHAKAIAKQAETERDLAALQEAKRKRAADMRDDRVAAENELSQVGETAQEKQARLLKEFATLQGAAHAAAMQQIPEAEKLREEAAKKQKEIAEQAIELGKEAAKVEEDRAKKAKEAAEKEANAIGKKAQIRREGAQLTLGELAAEGKGQVGRDARRAMKEEEKARKAALRGDLEGAQAARDRATNIKRGIGTLKDSEKDVGDAFSGALEQSQVLKKIEKNTGGMGIAKP